MFQLIWDFMSFPIPVAPGVYFKLQYIFYGGMILLLFRFYMNFVKKV